MNKEPKRPRLRAAATCLALATGFLGCAEEHSQSSLSGRLEFAKRTLSLGTFDTVGTITGRFEFENRGPGVAVFDGIALSCGCSTAKFEIDADRFVFRKRGSRQRRGLFVRQDTGEETNELRIPVGAKGAVLVDVDMTQVLGQRWIDMRMRYADTGEYETLNWTVTGTPPYHTVPNDLSFGSVMIGATASGSFRVVTTRPVGWKFSGVTTSTPGATAKFAAESDGGRITFDAVLQELGTQEVALEVQTTDPSVRFTVYPSFVATSAVKLDPGAVVDFGRVEENAQPSRTLVIEPVGSTRLTGASVSTVGWRVGPEVTASHELKDGKILLTIRLPSTKDPSQERFAGALRVDLQPASLGHVECAYRGMRLRR